MDHEPRTTWSQQTWAWAFIASLLGHAVVLVTAGLVAQTGSSGGGTSGPEVWAVRWDTGQPGGSSEPQADLPPDSEAQEPPEHELPFSATVTLPDFNPTPEPHLPTNQVQGSGPSAKANQAGGQGIGQGLGQGHEGAPGPATFFQVPLKSQKIVFLIDRSTSMAQTGGLVAAKREVMASLGQLEETTRFQVIVYNRYPLCIGGRRTLLPAKSEVMASVIEELESVGGEGGTDHVEAVRMGLTLEPDVLFLVTDADDLTLTQVRALTQQNGGRTIIHTLVWGHTSDKGGILLQLAHLNGGTFRGVGD